MKFKQFKQIEKYLCIFNQKGQLLYVYFRPWWVNMQSNSNWYTNQKPNGLSFALILDQLVTLGLRMA